MTPSKEVIVQFFLDNKNRHIPFKELQEELYRKVPDLDRTTIYRNIEKFISMGVIQELALSPKEKIYQYIFEKKVHHYYICKACGKINKGNETLFDKVEQALKDVHDFYKANLSLVFYGFCSKCESEINAPP